MPSNELVPRGSGPVPVPRPSTLQAVRQARALQRHAADVQGRAQREVVTLMASAAVTYTAIDEGLDLLAYGRSRAGNDPGADWLVAEFVAEFAECARARYRNEFAPQVWP